MSNVPDLSKATLADLEAIIDANLSAVYETCRSLAEIRDRKLYKDTHQSFEKYAFDRFSISLSTAKRWTELGKALQKELDAGVAPSVVAPKQGPKREEQVRGGHSRPIPTQRGVARANRKRDPIEATATEKAFPTAEDAPVGDEKAQPEPPPKLVGSSVVAALLASDPEAEAVKNTSAQGIEYATEGFRWFGSYEMKAKGVTSLRTPAGTTPGTKQGPKSQTPTSEGAAVQTQPDRQPDALSLGEQAKAFLRTLDATPADDYPAEDWRKFNRNFASKVFKAIKAKTDALEKKAKK